MILPGNITKQLQDHFICINFNIILKRAPPIRRLSCDYFLIGKFKHLVLGAQKKPISLRQFL